MDIIQQAFGKADSLHRRIVDAIRTTPQHRTLFEDIATYHVQHDRPSLQPTGEPASKKRKLPNGALPVHTALTGQRNTILEAPDISFSIPQRKKLVLGVYHYPRSDTKTVAVKNPATKEIEFELSADQIGTSLRLPVPEKTQRQWNYVLLPRTGAGEEGILFTVTVGDVAAKKTTGWSPIEEAIAFAGLELVCPDEAEFSSATPESHRKTEKAYHVKAFRGSKDGFLFFLETGIFFGFKKPLFFVRLGDIESVSYTSVLQRTFNMVISYLECEQEKEVEFSMLDQADYAGINGYVGRHGLSDKSLAEGRGAKLAKKGKEVKAQGLEGAEAEEEEEDGRTELEKVEAQLQDEEDEMEEDFELDSDDEASDASGDDDDADDEDGGDLVKEELGSEAEDVSDEEDEDEDEDEDEEEEQNEGDEHEGEKHKEPIDQAKQPARQVIVPPQRRANEPDPEDEEQL